MHRQVYPLLSWILPLIFAVWADVAQALATNVATAGRQAARSALHEAAVTVRTKVHSEQARSKLHHGSKRDGGESVSELHHGSKRDGGESVSEASLDRIEQTAWPFWKQSVRQKNMANKSLRMEYMETKIDLDMKAFDKLLLNQYNVLEAAPVPPSQPLDAWKPPADKVAFLFMLMKDLSWEQIWGKLFAKAPKGRFSIYVHRASVRDEDAHQTPLPLTAHGALMVPWVNTSWCALMGLEAIMLQMALSDPLNKQMVFLSQDTVPLKHFSYIYDSLIVRSPLTSKMCFAESARHKLASVEQISNEVGRRCCFRDFYQEIHPRVLKHHQWVVLSKQHAETIVRRARDGLEFWSKTWMQATPDLTTMGEGCSDEGVPATTLLLEAHEQGGTSGNVWDDLAAIGVEQECLTFVNWYNCFRRTKFSLPGSGVLQSVRERGTDLWKYMFDKDFDFVHDTHLNGFPSVYKTVDRDYLSALVNSGFMFARKFPPKVKMTKFGNYTPSDEKFPELLPRLWTKLDEEEAHLNIWQRLQSEFKPRPIKKLNDI